MANNLSVTAGAGTTVATDQGPSGEHYQLVKIVDSTEDSTTRTGIATSPLQVSVANTGANATAVKVDNSAVTQPVSGTVTANLSATDNAVLDQLELNQDAQTALLTTIDTDTSKIPAQGQALASASMPVVLPADQITTLTPPSAITGFATSAKQDTLIGHVDGVETLLGTIDADTSTLAGAVAGTELQVDVVSSALPTGASTADKQPALGTAGTASTDVITVQGIATMTPLLVTADLGANNDVTVTGTVDLGATDNAVLDTIATNTGATLTDTELRATPVPVSGSLTVDLGANNDVTVTGTVDLGATDNAVLDAIASDGDAIQTVLGTIDGDTGAIKTAVEVIDNAISGSEMQVDVVGALPAGTNTIGLIKITDGTETVAINASNQMEVEVKNTSLTVSGTNLRARTDTLDSVRSYQQSDGLYYDAGKSLTKFAVIDHATSGDNTIVSAIAGKRILVVNFAFVASAATTVRFESGTGGTALTGQMSFAANSGMAPSYCPLGHFKTGVGELLNMELSAANSIDGWITYLEV